MPLLDALLCAEEHEREAVSGVHLAEVADELLVVAGRLRDCVVWPVGRAAERVVGAAAVRAREPVEFGTWGFSVARRDVLLLDIAGVSPLSMLAAAATLRAHGAAAIHACAVNVVGAAECTEFDSFTYLGPSPSGASAPKTLRAA